jgi:hypothetical protein
MLDAPERRGADIAGVKIFEPFRPGGRPSLKRKRPVFAEHAQPFVQG